MSHFEPHTEVQAQVAGDFVVVLNKEGFIPDSIAANGVSKSLRVQGRRSLKKGIQRRKSECPAHIGIEDTVGLNAAEFATELNLMCALSSSHYIGVLKCVLNAALRQSSPNA